MTPHLRSLQVRRRVEGEPLRSAQRQRQPPPPLEQQKVADMAMAVGKPRCARQRQSDSS